MTHAFPSFPARLRAVGRAQVDALPALERCAKASRKRHLLLFGEALPLDRVHYLLELEIRLLFILAAVVVREDGRF